MDHLESGRLPWQRERELCWVLHRRSAVSAWKQHTSFQLTTHWPELLSHGPTPVMRVQSCHVPTQGRAGNILWVAQNDDPDINRLLQSTAHLNPVIINNTNMKRHIHFKKHQRENSDAFSYSTTCLLSVSFKESRTNSLKANIFQTPWLFFFFFSQPVSHPASSF